MTDATDATSVVAQVRKQPLRTRSICGALAKRTGRPCGNRAGQRTDHEGTGRCFLHGGRSPNGRKHAATLSARQQLERLTAEPLTPEQYIDPIGALLYQVTIAAMMEAACREEVMRLTDWRGDVFALTREGDAVAISEDARAMVKLHLEWHKAVVAAAKACAAAKIDERVTALAERQGAMLEAAFRLYMERMGYTVERMAEGRRVFAGAFRELLPALGSGS